MSEPNKCKDCPKETVNRSTRCAGCEEKHKEKQKRRWKDHVEAGLCTRCRKRPKAPGIESCFECAFKMKEGEVEDFVSLEYGPPEKKPRRRPAYGDWLKNR